MAAAQISKPLWSNKLTTTAGSSSTWAPIRTPSRSAGGLGVKEGQSVTYAKGKSRDTLLTVSENVRGYRNARMEDPCAAMPEFTDTQRKRLADE